MSTVNAPVCLLARNEFYRSFCPTEKIKHLSGGSMEPKPPQVTIWVTTFKTHDFSGALNNSWTVNVVFRNPSSRGSSSKRVTPADRVVK